MEKTIYNESSLHDTIDVSFWWKLGKFSPLVSRLLKEIDGGIELWLDEGKSLP